MDRVEIGKKIEMLRTKKGITKNKLATDAGLSPSYIRTLELGLKCPTVEVLDSICYALGTTLNAFFSETDDTATNKLASLNEKQLKLLNDFLLSL